MDRQNLRPAFPVELVYHIVDQLLVPDDHGATQVGDVKQLRLVCHDWSVVARQRLFSHITIYDHRTTPFLDHYRLRVPRYGAVLEFFNVGVLLFTFCLCILSAWSGFSRMEYMLNPPLQPTTMIMLRSARFCSSSSQRRSCSTNIPLRQSTDGSVCFYPSN